LEVLAQGVGAVAAGFVTGCLPVWFHVGWLLTDSVPHYAEFVGGGGAMVAGSGFPVQFAEIDRGKDRGIRDTAGFAFGFHHRVARRYGRAWRAREG